MRLKRKGSGESRYLFLRRTQVSFACTHLHTCESHCFHHFIPLLRNSLGCHYGLLWLCPVSSSTGFLGPLKLTLTYFPLLTNAHPVLQPRLSPYSILSSSSLFSPLCRSPLPIFQVFTDSPFYPWIFAVCAMQFSPGLHPLVLSFDCFWVFYDQLGGKLPEGWLRRCIKLLRSGRERAVDLKSDLHLTCSSATYQLHDRFLLG